MKKRINKLPDFNKMTRTEEATWFDSHDLGDYWDEFKPVDVVVELAKPKEETLILRMNKEIKNKLAQTAKEKGMTTSTLARMWIIEKLRSI